jgi:hypothetical protein
VGNADFLGAKSSPCEGRGKHGTRDAELIQVGSKESAADAAAVRVGDAAPCVQANIADLDAVNASWHEGFDFRSGHAVSLPLYFCLFA